MKKIVFGMLAVFVLTTACKNEKKDHSAAITFDEKEYNFGEIAPNSISVHEFTFTNTGGSDLIIRDAKGSCGCTVPEFPKGEKIAPGQKGKIKVSFNSKGKRGDIRKSVTLLANIDKGDETIYITGHIADLNGEAPKN
ncbi:MULTISPECIES: DUF1573 domain-containing protein [unclassified Flavobacterium]|uniref:DUF1573 domain-containing protein n=1 Tax=unclassified Flavobacterium TaxID=196869 RepID=UPI001F139A1F|nr:MULTISPECIES: DUF1573 domain-containing protein [unclassified Flavobacterium]UMY65181.1 DUF1573 domain-containing protein [Flavobacterium sp. HJ-32-4]